MGDTMTIDRTRYNALVQVFGQCYMLLGMEKDPEMQAELLKTLRESMPEPTCAEHERLQVLGLTLCATFEEAWKDLELLRGG